MKKRVALFLCASLAAATLAGCSGSGGTMPKLDPKSPVSLEIWHYYNGPQKEAFDALVAEFNETIGQEQGIVVEAYNQGTVNELASKVVDAAKKKVGAADIPDIFAAYADTAYQIDKLGLLTDISAYLTEEELSAYREEFVEEGHISGEETLKIFPIAKSVELLMVNKTDWDQFSAATGASEEELKTMEGVTRLAKSYYEYTDALTPDVPGDGKAFFGRDAMANYMIIGCRQLGVEIFQVEGDSVKINVDKQALRKIWDNYYVPYINGWFSDEGRFRSDTAHTGTIIALVGSSSGAVYFPTEVQISDLKTYPIDYAVYPVPAFEGGEAYTVQQGAGMCVTKSDEKMEYAATIFLKWFTESERNANFSVGSGYLPVTTAALTNEVLDKALNASGNDERMRQTLRAALEEINSNTFYTTAPFDQGIECRSVLESALTEKCQADRQLVLAALEEGADLAQTVARFDTEANFNGWVSSLSEALQSAAKG